MKKLDDCTWPVSTRGYPGGERQRLEVDITIIGPRQGRRPSQKSIDLILAKVQNKVKEEGKLCLIYD